MRFISIFLILSCSVFAQIGALSGGSASALDTGIFFNSALITSDQAADINGAAFITATGVTYDDAGGTPDNKFSQASIGANVIVGMYAFISGTNITPGYYEITSIAGDDSWVACSGITATGDNADSVVNIGGACPIVDAGASGSVGSYELQDVLDDALSSAAANDVDIYVAGPGTLTSTIVIDNGGTSTTLKSLIATDATYVYNPAVNDDGTLDATATTLTTATSLVSGLIQFTTVTQWVEIKGFILDAGAGAGNADYCIFSSDDSEQLRINSCVAKNADSHGIQLGSFVEQISIANCHIFDNGGRGISPRATTRGFFNVFGCKIYDNDSDGVVIGRVCGGVFDSQIYGNKGNGIEIEAAGDQPHISSNTIYGNEGHGIDAGDAALTMLWIHNNTLVGNGVDAGGPWYGIYLAGTPTEQISYFAHNHSENNFDGHSDQAVSDAAWIAFKHGGQIVGDGAGGTTETLIFTNVSPGTEDFTPPAASPLVNAGVGASTIGALSATAGAGGGTGGQPVINGAIVR